MTAPSDPIALALARLEVKIDQLIRDSSDHELRLRNLESRRWPVPMIACGCSVIAVLTSLVPFLVQ